METQVCNKCGKEKPLTDYYFRSDNKTYRKDCKDCFKQAKAERESKPGIKELRALKERERRAKDDGTINAKAREYHRSEHSKNVSRKWIKSNTDKIRNYNRTQRARRKFALLADESATTQEVKAWIDSQNPICAYCSIELSENQIQLDHIIPLSKGGLHTIDNFAISCKSCNCSKGNKTLDEFIIYKELHLKLIEASDKKH